MTDPYRVAIIGSGPGGLAAAVTSARLEVSHILLEKEDHLADTIYKYQKHKEVMAHPNSVPLQPNSLTFGAESDKGVVDIREPLLNQWQKEAEQVACNVRFHAEAVKIRRENGAFTIELAKGEPVRAETVIMAIGLQGNVRKLPIPGADQPWIQYQLDDADAYHNERIVVIGGGDSGIENALALCGHNDVTITNTRDSFVRAKQRNAAAVEREMKAGRLRVYQNARPIRVNPDSVVIKTPDGEKVIPCQRIIARLGATPPRQFLDDCGIKFSGPDAGAAPLLSPKFETSVEGLFVIGALAGYTLIKHAINQGYEVAHHIAGKECLPVDESLLANLFAEACPGMSVDEVLAMLQEEIPLLAPLSVLQLREVMLDSNLVRFEPGQYVVRLGDYTNSVWTIAQGAVGVVVGDPATDQPIRIGAGEFFGEAGLTQGRRRNADVLAVEPSLLLEIPRRTMLRLLASVPEIKADLEAVALRRLVRNSLAPDRQPDEIADVIAAAKLISRKKDDGDIITEGDPCDALYILRSGRLIVSRLIKGHDVVVAYIEPGSFFGQRGLIDDTPRTSSVRASIDSDIVRIPAETIRNAMPRLTSLRAQFEDQARDQIRSEWEHSVQSAESDSYESDADAVSRFFMAQGLVEATNAFIIDEALCIRCDNCEKACAATHDGVSRVRREAGTTSVSIKIPITCRHCETPHCMSDCPAPGAIVRDPNGEVMIDYDLCIGCSQCADNCPYGVIVMGAPTDHQPESSGLFGWLLEGIGLKKSKKQPHGYGNGPEREGEPHIVKAVKCDLCRNTGTPACVSACPTGAAVRVSPEQYLDWVRGAGLNRRAL